MIYIASVSYEMASEASKGSNPDCVSRPMFSGCPTSIMRGIGIGVGLGAAFHLVSGGLLRGAGRTTLSREVIVRQATSASLRLGAVLGLFTAVRCGTAEFTTSPALPSLLAGAAAVAVPTAVMPERQAFLRAYYANVLKKPKSSVSLGVIIASSAVSGAATFGVADWLLGKAGMQW